MENKSNTLLAVALSLGVILAFQYFVPSQKPAPEQVVAQTGQPAQPASQPAAAPSGITPALSTSQAPAVAQAHQPTVTRTLANELVSYTISSVGAKVTRAELNEYLDAPEGERLVLLAAPAGYDHLGATSLTSTAPQTDLTYEFVSADEGSVTLRRVVAEGVTVEKRYSLAPTGYDLDLSVTVINANAIPLRDQLTVSAVQDFSNNEDADQYVFRGPAFQTGDDFVEVDLDDLDEGEGGSGDIPWAVMTEKYFLTGIVPAESAGNTIRLGNHLGLDNVASVKLSAPAFDVGPSMSRTFEYKLYAGPKQEDILRSVGNGFERAINYGYFDIIAQPLQTFLNFIYGFVGNWGVAIIILTTIVKAIFWPLSAKSYKSMAKMKEIQPKMQRLKDKYGEDKERLNREVMQLYKTHKVNPLGGCLPMLVQIPVFFALYRILMSSIELRHAHFGLWLTDLSAKDPYYITPLLMGLSMFLQQRMSPSTGVNETQMKMMMYGMPIVFTFLFLGFPSGLVIYWLVNNLLSIFQQWLSLREKAKAQAA